MLLFSSSGLVEDNAVGVFYHYGVHLSSSVLMQIFSWLAGLCYYGDDMEEYRRLCSITDSLECSLLANPNLWKKMQLKYSICGFSLVLSFPDVKFQVLSGTITM